MKGKERKMQKYCFMLSIELRNREYFSLSFSLIFLPHDQRDAAAAANNDRKLN
jgi:hypothetical protein